MKKQILIILFSILSINLYAQSQLEAATIDFKEKNSYVAKLKISFGTEAKQEASLMVMDNMFILEFGEQKIFSDGESNFTYTQSANELVIRKIDSLSPLHSPRSLLYINKELFNIIEKKTIGTESIYTIKTKNNIADIADIKVILNNDTLNEIVVTDNTNNRLNILILDVNFNPNLKKQQFIYSPRNYKNVEIIDFR